MQQTAFHKEYMMTAVSMTLVEPRPVQFGERRTERTEAMSFTGEPAIGNHARGCTKQLADKNHARPRRALEHALNQPGRLLTLVEQHELAARIKTGDRVAREALIVANLRLVVNIAKHYYSYGATLDDLIQEGNRGLILAVERYDPATHNTRFSTYASYWIRNSIQRAISANFSLIRMPDYMFRLNVRKNKNDGYPRTEDRAAMDDRESATLAPCFEISHRRRQLLNRSIISQSSYYGIDCYGEETSLEETIADTHPPEQDMSTAESLDELHKALDQLTPVEAWLVRRRFGLADPPEDSPSAVSLAETVRIGAGVSREWTYKRLSRALGISIPRVRQVEEGAMGKLRSWLGSRAT